MSLIQELQKAIQSKLDIKEALQEKLIYETVTNLFSTYPKLLEKLITTNPIDKHNLYSISHMSDAALAALAEDVLFIDIEYLTDLVILSFAQKLDVFDNLSLEEVISHSYATQQNNSDNLSLEEVILGILVTNKSDNTDTMRLIAPVKVTSHENEPSNNTLLSMNDNVDVNITEADVQVNIKSAHLIITPDMYTEDSNGITCISLNDDSEYIVSTVGDDSEMPVGKTYFIFPNASKTERHIIISGNAEHGVYCLFFGTFADRLSETWSANSYGFKEKDENGDSIWLNLTGVNFTIDNATITTRRSAQISGTTVGGGPEIVSYELLSAFYGCNSKGGIIFKYNNLTTVVAFHRYINTGTTTIAETTTAPHNGTGGTIPATINGSIGCYIPVKDMGFYTPIVAHPVHGLFFCCGQQYQKRTTQWNGASRSHSIYMDNSTIKLGKMLPEIIQLASWRQVGTNETVWATNLYHGNPEVSGIGMHTNVSPFYVDAPRNLSVNKADVADAVAFTIKTYIEK